MATIDHLLHHNLGKSLLT